MEVKISEPLARAIGLSKLKGFNVDEEDFTWKKFVEVSLREMPEKDLDKLVKLIEPHEKIRGTKVLLKDIAMWKQALKAPAKAHARTVKGFTSLLIEALAKTPGHRIFEKNDLDGVGYKCYYVREIKFHPERKERGNYYPAYCEMETVYDCYDGRHTKDWNFHLEEVYGKSILAILAENSLYPETPEMRETYLAEVKRYREIVLQIGKQFLADGIGSDNLKDGQTTNRGYYDRWTKFKFGGSSGLDRPHKVLIDTFVDNEDEDKETKSKRDVHLGGYFWSEYTGHEYAEDEEEDDEDDVESDTETKRWKGKNKEGKTTEYSGKREGLPPEDLDDKPRIFTIEIPVHPLVIIYDLLRHKRLSIHVSYLTDYVYDKKMSERLILPPYIKTFIKLLVEQRTRGFRDIIAGKSGGTIVLLTGKPGVGKTLTAEVFSESEEKPLYTVQASQLGTDPEELEEQLLKVIRRAQKWGALLLIDEADVYVRTRGEDLTQNAIVGVFLRVLEYHSTVMFLTTNRPDLVDDAIASRCIARIDYPYPTKDEQKKIWRVLADSAGVPISEKTIETIAEKHTNLSGRDVKNLLKLAWVYMSFNGEDEVSVEAVDYVKRFKPTVDEVAV